MIFFIDKCVYFYFFCKAEKCFDEQDQPQLHVITQSQGFSLWSPPLPNAYLCCLGIGASSNLLGRDPTYIFLEISNSWMKNYFKAKR